LLENLVRRRDRVRVLAHQVVQVFGYASDGRHADVDRWACREAGTLTAIGDIHQSRADLDRAESSWLRAADLYRAQNLQQAATRVEKRPTPQVCRPSR
jgi:hypothetical protein